MKSLVHLEKAVPQSRQRRRDLPVSNLQLDRRKSAKITAAVSGREILKLYAELISANHTDERTYGNEA